MPDPLLISEISTRCLASIARCFEEGNNRKSNQAMKAEIREIAREVAVLGFSGEAKARIFLRPMEDVLVHNYGSHNGRRLYWDFVDAFWLQSWSATLLSFSETSPPVEPPIECETVT